MDFSLFHQFGEDVLGRFDVFFLVRAGWLVEYVEGVVGG